MLCVGGPLSGTELDLSPAWDGVVTMMLPDWERQALNLACLQQLSRQEVTPKSTRYELRNVEYRAPNASFTAVALVHESITDKKMINRAVLAAFFTKLFTASIEGK